MSETTYVLGPDTASKLAAYNAPPPPEEIVKFDASNPFEANIGGQDLDFAKQYQCNLVNQNAYKKYCEKLNNEWKGQGGTTPTTAPPAPPVYVGIDYPAFVNWLRDVSQDNSVYIVALPVKPQPILESPDPLPHIDPTESPFGDAVAPGIWRATPAGVAFAYQGQVVPFPSSVTGYVKFAHSPFMGPLQGLWLATSKPFQSGAPASGAGTAATGTPAAAAPAAG